MCESNKIKLNLTEIFISIKINGAKNAGIKHLSVLITPA